MKRKLLSSSHYRPIKNTEDRNDFKLIHDMLTEKANPVKIRGRKDTGLRLIKAMTAGPPKS